MMPGNPSLSVASVKPGSSARAGIGARRRFARRAARVWPEDTNRVRNPTGRENMAVLLALLLVALLFGLGFAVKVLWLVALVALALWIIGFFVAGAERRWYHW